jgi:hypothetical protein
VLAHAAARVAALLQEVSRFDLDRWLRDAPEEPDGA